MKALPLQVRVVRNARKRGVNVLTRKQWGSRYGSVYARRLVTHRHAPAPSDTLWQHITVTTDTGKLVGDFKEDMRTIERIGMERFGSGFSYNFAIDMQTGMVGVGQPLRAKGTHTVNDKGARTPSGGFISHDQNYVALAFAWLGMPGRQISDKAKESAAQLFAALMDEGALTQSPDYLPHSLVAAKDCPTDAGRDAMPWIRRRAQEVKKQRR